MRLSAALLVVTCLGCGAPPVGSTRSAIVDGTPTTGDPAVVGLVLRRAGCEQKPSLFCTGTLIAPRAVLTAAHCLADASGPNAIEVYFGSDTTGDASGQLMLASDTGADPAYDASSGANDIAVLQLPRDAPVSPVALGAAPPPAATQVRIMGFGAVMGDGLPDGLKRSGTMTVSSVDASTFALAPAPSNSCVGDSGGPVLAGAPGAEQLVGVTVRGDFACTTSAVAQRIDGDAASFISSYVAATQAAPIQPPLGGQDFSHICSACRIDTDCPTGLHCQASGDSAMSCVVPGNLPGSLGEACAHDSDCGPNASCARLDPDACRCLRACPTGSGCDFTSRSPTGYQVVFTLFLVALVTLRRRLCKI